MPSPSSPPRTVAFAGIARPERFFATLRLLGYDVVREVSFRDHHWFTARDVHDIQQAARESGASVIVTTEKDAMRLDSLPDGIPFAYLPMTVEIGPASAFEVWLLDRLARARACVSADSAGAPDAHGRKPWSVEGR